MSNFTGLSAPQAHEASSSSLATRALAYLREQLQRFQAVNELEQLSDRQLRDIGVDRRQINEVAAREIARLRTK